MQQEIKRIVILGGGSAGWLTAGVIAAEHSCRAEGGVSVTLVESPDVSPIGVGEGTWPTMRETLARIGVSETDFFRECDAAFKQGAKFAKWVTGKEDDYYYHPLVLPHGFNKTDVAGHWMRSCSEQTFADAVCAQSQICEHGLAPKQITTPEYASVANYAYHLDSVKLGQFLMRHCTEKLGVTHVLDHVVEVTSAENGDIAALLTKEHGSIEGDLFVDCSGLGSMLLGKHFQVPFIGKKHILFNDTALAVQIPYPSEGAPMASHTISTAQSAGWIWDIGLPTRKGVGHVYSSAHISEEQAAVELRAYIAKSLGEERASELNLRKISIEPGHRESFWYRNCVGVGMAAGFLEPLEASALVLVESSARIIAEDLPPTRDVMDVVSSRFNRRLNYYWESIVDFLKLHYILTKRTDTAYWRDNVKPESIPERLAESLRLWRQQVPNQYDFPMVEEMFPAASWQYILYGMGFETRLPSIHRQSANTAQASRYFDEARIHTEKCLKGLPKNRDLINKIREFGMQRI